jgi:hypothetical protein
VRSRMRGGKRTQMSETFVSSLGPGGVLVNYKRRHGRKQNEDTDGEPTTRQGHAKISYRTLSMDGESI